MAKRSGRGSGSNRKLFYLILAVLVAIYLYNNPDLLNPKNESTSTGQPAKKNTTQPATEKKQKKTASSGQRSAGAVSVDNTFEKQADFGLPAYTPADQVVRHQGYALNYVEKYEQPSWVAYQLLATETVGESERANDFRPDPEVKTGSAIPEDYKASGYDRGHLAPAADFKFSPELMSESFFMSNMSPQVPDFNRGIWENLESRVRTWVKRDEVLYIVTGPILEDGLPTIGKRNKVAVPEMYYKIILDLKEPQVKAIAFLLRNEGSKKPLGDFAVPIDSVEKVTGLDFFPHLPDNLEKELESQLDIETWFKR
jgi:endonuclease G